MSEKPSAEINDAIKKDYTLSESEKKAFKKYLKEKVLIDGRVDIAELTKGKLRYFINDEWGKLIEEQLGLKGGVKKLQQVLGIDDDGYFGADTLKALLEFQIELGLEPDGIIGNETIVKLNENGLIEKPKVEVNERIIDDIEIGDNEVLKVFNKTRKGKLLLRLIKDYSSVSVEKLSELILKSANAFDIPYNRIVSVIIGEADVSIKKNPFKVNEKGVGQFLEQTFKDLFSNIKRKSDIFIEGNVLQYLSYKKHTKYADALKNIGINSLSDRQDPEKSIMAIGAYLRYILISGKGINGNIHLAVGRYNVGPNGSTLNHFETNPAIKEHFEKIYGKNSKITEYKMVRAAADFYGKSIYNDSQYLY